MLLIPELQRLLEYLDNNIRYDVLSKEKSNIINALDFKSTTPYFTYSLPQSTEFSGFSLADGEKDMQKMLCNELLGVTRYVANSSNDSVSGLPSIRANFGTGILPSLFGAKSVFIDEYQLPWCQHLTIDEVRSVADKGDVNLSSGYGDIVIQTYQFYHDVLKDYPNLYRCINFFHPDLQGPFDVLHMMYGSKIYYDMYDNEDLVHELLQIVTDTYIKFMKKAMPYVKSDIGDDRFCYHWGSLYPGKVVVRDDTGVTIGRDMYNEFSLKYIKQIISEFGGISLHYCGANMPWLEDLIHTDGIMGVNFGYIMGKDEQYGLNLIKTFNTLRRDKKICNVCYNILDKSTLDGLEPYVLSGGTYKLL